MDESELRDFQKWIGKSAEKIISSVKDIKGGWATVFPGDLPLFAHQIRNFFNVEPKTLTRINQGATDEMIGLIQIKMQKWGLVDRFKGVVALSGDAYKDEVGRTWFQMSAGGAIYHWGGDPTWDIADAYRSNYIRGQDGIPVFKLICPDGTGGSMETIIENDKQSVIGKVGETVRVEERVVRRYRHQGSYNYSETVENGLPAHERHDVTPHKKYPEYYLNYPNRFTPLASRGIPARRPDGKLIGYEKGWEPFEFDTTRPDPPVPRRTTATFTDPLAELMTPRYPANHPGSLERVKKLEEVFRLNGKPKALLARIEARKDKASNDFHTILHPDTQRRLLKILRDRPPGPNDRR